MYDNNATDNCKTDNKTNSINNVTNNNNTNNTNNTNTNTNTNTSNSNSNGPEKCTPTCCCFEVVMGKFCSYSPKMDKNVHLYSLRYVNISPHLENL